MATELRPAGLPLDTAGFPVPLTRIREEVHARGGDIEPFHDRWRATHRTRGVPAIFVYFHTDGWVEVGFGKFGVFLKPPEDAYSTDFGDGTLTSIEAVVMGILQGGYREAVLLDDRDVYVGSAYELDYPGGSSGSHPRHPESVREVWWSYPRWPARSGDAGEGASG